MGDPHKKKQVEYAKKRREIAMREASEPRLPIHSAIRTIKLTLLPVEGVEYVCGEKLSVMADETAVRVVRNGYENVGSIEGESALELRAMFEADGGSNVVQVCVTDVANISGVAHAEVIQP